MDTNEARKAVAAIAAYFPDLALEEPTVRAWAAALGRFDADVVGVAIHRIGEGLGRHPLLRDVLDACNAETERRDQRERQRLELEVPRDPEFDARVREMLGRVAKPVDLEPVWSEEELAEAERRREVARVELRKLEGDAS